jgi:high-affinity iron transporter
MLAAAIIVFREVLEASLIVGVVMAATYGVAGRAAWVAGGIALGVAGAVAVACGADAIAAAVSGIGSDLFNAAILITAVGMLGWHNIWMSRHGRELAASADRLGSAIREGAQPLWALGIAVAVAVLREGSEIVLFLYSIAVAGEVRPATMVAGGALGLLAGAAAGATIYFGLLRIPLRHLFTVTSWLVLLLAAGMASQAAAFLLQADLLPPLGENVWDTSSLLSEQSLVGKLLHTLIGYSAQPAGIQLVFYITTLLLIGGLTRVIGHRSLTPPRVRDAAPAE